MVTTLGIDLASRAASTAVCAIEWTGGGAQVALLERGGWTDERLIDALRGAELAAIDAPFGWPEPFVQALTSGRWSEPRARYERRTTDLVVHRRTGKLPMSVSTDRIAYCAMRCLVLLGSAGRERAVEAYPDASLRCWLPEMWPAASYKINSDRREQLLAGLLAGLGPRFDLGGHADACVESDDCLDALVCALVARAAQRGQTIPPETAEQRRLAAVEGWIHLPRPGSLGRLL